MLKSQRGFSEQEQNSSEISDIILSEAVSQSAEQETTNNLQKGNKKQLLRQALTFLFAKKFLEKNPITKVINCVPKRRINLNLSKQIDAQQIRRCIMITINKRMDKILANLRQKSIGMTQQLIFDPSEGQEVKVDLISNELQQLIVDSSRCLQQSNKNLAIYRLIAIKWSEEFRQKIFSHFNAHQEEKSLPQLINQLEASLQLEKQKNKKVHQKNIFQFCIDLSNPINNLIAKIQDQSLREQFICAFRSLNQQIKVKQTELQRYKICTSEFQVVIKSQLQMLSLKQCQNQQLSQQAQLFQNSLLQVSNRCTYLEEQVKSVLQQWQGYRENVKNVPTYYINPLQQKNRLQEKYLEQIIQLQSDVFLQRNNVKVLSDVLIDIIHLAHENMFDLMASKKTLYRFDREVAHMIKNQPMLSNIILDGVLMRQQNGMLDAYSEGDSLRKSTISTFSSMQCKMRYETMQSQIENVDLPEVVS